MQQQITFEPIGGVIEVLLIFTLLSNFTINITCKMWWNKFFLFTPKQCVCQDGLYCNKFAKLREETIIDNTELSTPC